MRRLLAVAAIALASFACFAPLGGGAVMPQTGVQAPLSSTLQPGAAELLSLLGGPGALSGSYWGSTTGGTTHAGYGDDWRSYHYHGQALDLRPDVSLWNVLYEAMMRANYGLVELYGPWGLYKNGLWLDRSSHRRLWAGHQNHIHVSFTGTPDEARAIVELPARPQAAPARFALPPRAGADKPPIQLEPTRRLAVVTFRPLAAAVSAVPEGAGLLYGGLGTMLIVILVVLLVLGAAVLALTAKRERWLEGRLAAHVAPPPVEQPPQARSRKRLLAPLFAATERLVGRLDVYRKTARLLERADLPIRAVEFLYLSAAAAAVCAVLGGVAGGGLVGLIGLLIGAAAPWLFVRMKARRRKVAFENQLPDVLVTLASTLKSGHSFRQGLQAVADEGQPPISKELVRVLTEARLGRPLDEALADMTARVGSKDLDFLLAAITIQTQVGGSMSGLFDLVSETVRERQQFARKIAGLTATARASAKVLIALPAFLAVALTMINGDYMRPLFHSSTGHMLLGISVLMTGIGALVLRKMVSFRA